MIAARDVATIYEVPLMFSPRGAGRDPARAAQPPPLRPRPVAWESWSRGSRTPQHEVRIGIVGKYVEFADSYKIAERGADRTAASPTTSRCELVYIDAEELEDEGWPREICRGRRHPAGADRLRPARHRGEDPRHPLRPRAQGAVLRHLPRHAVHDDRVRAERRAASRTPTPRSSTTTPSTRSSTSCAT